MLTPSPQITLLIGCASALQRFGHLLHKILGEEDVNLNLDPVPLVALRSQRLALTPRLNHVTSVKMNVRRNAQCEC